MSDIETSFFTRSLPIGERVFSVMLSLFALLSLKCPSVFRFTGNPSGVLRPAAAPLVAGFVGHSTLITSAPKAPSQRVHHGPALTHVKSRTLIPSSGLGPAISLTFLVFVAIIFP